MQTLDSIQKYAQTVSEQIRWKRGRQVIAREIENHLIDQRDAYMREGVPEDEAADMAVEQMGDPVDVGTRLDRVHRPKPEWSMILLTGLALSIGLCIQLFVIRQDGPHRSSLLPIVAALAGILCMTGAYFLDFTILGKYPKAIFIGVFVICVFSPLPYSNAILVSSSFYPSVALLFPLALSALIYRCKGKGWKGFLLCGIALILASLPGLTVHSVTSFAIMLVSGLALLLVAIHINWFGIRKAHAYAVIAVIFLAAVILPVLFAYLQGGYAWSRLIGRLAPALDPNGDGYVTRVTGDILSGAKLIGPGTVSTVASGVPGLPLVMDTDFVLVYTIYRYGWIAFADIMLVLGLFIVRGFQLCLRQKTRLGLLVSTSVMLTITLQTVVYVFANLGLQVLSPLTLPLISYGNTAMVVNQALIGVMLSVFRSGAIARDVFAERRKSEQSMV